MFKIKLLIIAVLLLVLVVLFQVEKKKVEINGENIKKVQLFKDYPYNRYSIIVGNKRYEVNKVAYNKVK
jgi:CO dehydrogenase/acetyl-CoA synthase beta subunit